MFVERRKKSYIVIFGGRNYTKLGIIYTHASMHTKYIIIFSSEIDTAVSRELNILEV